MSQTIPPRGRPTPAAPAAATDPKTPLRNPLLQQTELQIESVLPPDQRESYLKIVVSGLHAMLDPMPPNGAPMVAGFRQSRDPVSDSAIGAAGIVVILYKKAQGAALPQALIPAGMTLTLKALDFAERMGIVKIAEPELDRAAHIYSDAMMRAFHITPEGVARATEKVHAAVQDPDSRRKILMHSGVIRDTSGMQPPPPGPPIGQPMQRPLNNRGTMPGQ